MLDERLEKLSVGRRLIASLAMEPRTIEFAVYRPGSGYTPERPALPFQFEIEAHRDDDPDGLPASRVLRGRAVVSNERNPLLPMPSSRFAFTLALPPAEAEELYYRDPVENPQQAAADAPPVWLA